MGHDGSNPSSRPTDRFGRRRAASSPVTKSVRRRVRPSAGIGLSRKSQARYALFRSYVLLLEPPIEPISHPIRASLPLGKAQRIDRQAYESPALPLSYSAIVERISAPARAGKLASRGWQRLTRPATQVRRNRISVLDAALIAGRRYR